MATERTTTSQTANRGVNNLSPVGYMLVAVLAFSLIPLAINLAGGPESPFLFNFWFRVGTAIGCLLFLLTFYRSGAISKTTLPLIWARIVKWPSNQLILGTIISTFDFALLAWAVKFIDIAVATILFETWPIFMILFTSQLFREERRYREINFIILGLTMLSLAGFILAIASQTTDVNSINSFYNLLWESRAGVGLVAVAIVATTFITSAWKWGSNLSEEVSDAPEDKALGLCYVVVAFLVASIVSSVISAGVALVENEGITSPGKIIAISFGIVLTFGNIAWGKANFTTDNLGINAIAYSIPIMSLLWLFAFSLAEVARFDYLVIGAAAIITANILINFEAEIRWGFKALLLALGTCGAVVYLRDGVFELLGVVKWNWTGSGYFESLTLAATVFTLLLAFRVARLVSRTSEEDNRTFIVYRKLDLLARRGIINPQVCDYILQIDQANNNVSVEQEAYTKARRLIADVDPRPLNEADSQLLSDAEANLDALARSKQVDIHLGEQFALGIFGAITVGLALLTLPPQVEGWTRLLVDLFAMLISAVIIFLLVHIQDLQRERDGSKLESLDSHAAYRNYLARFLDTRQRLFDQWLSFIVGGAIVLTYAALLAHKWVGWFG